MVKTPIDFSDSGLPSGAQASDVASYVTSIAQNDPTTLRTHFTDPSISPNDSLPPQAPVSSDLGLTVVVSANVLGHAGVPSVDHASSTAANVTPIAHDDPTTLRTYFTEQSIPPGISLPQQSVLSADGGLPTIMYGESFGEASIGSFSKGSGGGGSGTSGGTTPPTWTSPTINGLTFVVHWDSSVGNAPGAFSGAFETALNQLASNLGTPTPITINLNVGWGEAGGSRLSPFALGESLTNIDRVSYADMQSAMSSYLPSSDPITSSSHYYWVASAEERALGLPNSSSLDGSVGFSSHASWNFTSTPGSGQYDFISIAEHEISETMGRIALLGATISDHGVNYANSYTPMDLFRYNGTQRSLVGGQDAYFSYDGGISSNGSASNPSFTYFNSTAGGDWGDWQSTGAHTAGNDAYNAFASSATQYSLTPVDQTLMNVLGFHPQPTV
jgi:hypothetical protein